MHVHLFAYNKIITTGGSKLLIITTVHINYPLNLCWRGCDCFSNMFDLKVDLDTKEEVCTCLENALVGIRIFYSVTWVSHFNLSINLNNWVTRFHFCISWKFWIILSVKVHLIIRAKINRANLQFIRFKYKTFSQ